MTFPALTAALGAPPKYGWFPGYPLCAECGDKPCVCCPVCGEVFAPYLCGHGEPAAPPPIDPDVYAAVQVLKAHGIDGTKYEALQAMRGARA